MSDRDYDSDTCETALSDGSYDEDQHEFIDACRRREWEKVREWLEDDPSRTWEYESCYGMGVASYLAKYNNVELLQYVYELIIHETIDEPEQQQKLLREVFGKGHDKSPTHMAAKYSHITSLIFLMEHHPDGIDILETWSDGAAFLPIHLTRTRKCFEFLLRHGPEGIETLQYTNVYCEFPLQIIDDETYFTPQKIREVGLEREREHMNINMQSNSLPALTFDILQQQTDVLLFHNKSLSAIDREWIRIVEWLKERC